MMWARRGLRFNVRFLFALFAIISVVLARLSYLEHKRQTIVLEIKQCGGYVESQPIFGLNCLRASWVTHVYIPHDQTQDLDLEKLREFPRLEALTLLDYRLAWSVDPEIPDDSDGQIQRQIVEQRSTEGTRRRGQADSRLRAA